MTIKGIWTWANSVAQNVPASALRNKKLAIDGHIWLYESLEGCKTHHQTNPNSFLITFYSRIQRLRELKIEPIVVFDNINASSSTSADQEAFVIRKRHSFGDSYFTNLADHVFKLNVLLSHLDVQVIVSPGDGEAQCAHLEALGITSGCITNDFDYFLFGGSNLYKFDFNAVNFQHVTHLSIGRMKVEKKISRSHLISTAILLGCDYYEHGVQGVGIATVFDILAEFGEEDKLGIDPHVILDRFTSYVRGEIPARSEDSERKLRLRRKKYTFNPEFPNSLAVEHAIKMYLQPAVSDQNLKPTTPKSPNIRKVEQLLVKECGWSPQRMRKEVATSLKRTRNNTNAVTQTRIPEFFAATKKKRISPCVEPCTSIDDYISANNTWVSKRKSETPKQQQSTEERLRSDKISAHQPYPEDIIELDSD